MKKIALFLSVAMMLTLLAAPAAAVGFTPSVERKEAPKVAAVQDEAGQQVAGLIRDARGEAVISVPTGELIVTPVSKVDQAQEEIKNPLSQAYAQIQAARALTELAPSLEQILPSYDSEVSVADLVVRDVFDVSVSGTFADYLAVEGNTITIRFDLNLTPSALLLVLHNHSGSDWEIISKDRVVRNADGSVDVTFDSLSPVAFVVDGFSMESDPNAPTSPQTGDSSFPVGGITAVLLGSAVVAGVFLTRKKYMAE